MATPIVRPGTPADVDAANRLATEVFCRRPNPDPDMGAMYQHLFNQENASNLAVAESGGEIVSLVGTVHHTVRIGGARIGVASIGAVCTAKEQRGRGLGGQTLALAIDRAREREASLLWVSGQRSLYQRVGCVQAGLFTYLECEGGPWPAKGGVTVEAQEAPIEALCAVNALEAVRFERPPALMRQLVASWEEQGRDRSSRASSVALVRRDGEAVAWVAYRVFVREEGTGLWIPEFAGDRVAVAEGILQLAAEHDVGRVGMASPAHDTAWPLVLECVTQKRWVQSSGPHHGHSFTIIDEERLIDALAPYFAERGVDGRRFLRSAPSGDSARRAAHLTQALFAAGEGEHPLVPIPATGISYV